MNPLKARTIAGAFGAALQVLLPAGLAQGAESLAAVPSTCAGEARPMVVGYYDHTVAWYRRQPGFRTDQTVARTWPAGAPQAVVVLYSDISARKEGASPGKAGGLDTQQRIDERSADISEYLDAAERRGNVRVLLQLPPELARLWASEPQTREVLREFVKRWGAKPALTGFYVFDEPEISGIPARTLQEMRSLIHQHAPPGRNTTAISVSYSAIVESKPLLGAYARAKPRAFDVVLVNRYPVFRSYAAAGGSPNPSMGEKLGLGAQKAERERLSDNEFANLDDYFQSVAAAAGIPGLEGRPVYASVQAYGLRDDCAGADCKVVNERKARRSPTWNEMLHMFASAWMSGTDGAILYSRHFSLYDKALRRRLDNLERLIPLVFRSLPACGPTLRSQGSGGATAAVARYADFQADGKPRYLVLINRERQRTSVEVRFDRRYGPVASAPLVFDAQGKLADAAPPAGKQGGTRELRATLGGFETRILKLYYE